MLFEVLNFIIIIFIIFLLLLLSWAFFWSRQLWGLPPPDGYFKEIEFGRVMIKFYYNYQFAFLFSGQALFQLVFPFQC